MTALLTHSHPVYIGHIIKHLNFALFIVPCVDAPLGENKFHNDVHINMGLLFLVSLMVEMGRGRWFVIDKANRKMRFQYLGLSKASGTV